MATHDLRGPRDETTPTGEAAAADRAGPPTPRADFAAHLNNVLAWPAQAELHFQPIVDLREGLVTGYEALARFPREVGLAPNLWFEKAGQLGRRDELQSLMARKALNARKLLPRNCFLTINAAPDFVVKPACRRLLDHYPDLSGVVIEITEETSIEDYDRLRSALTYIRRKGGLVAVDDAGAGYASLHHILEIKPDFIKIDRHFIQNCGFDRARSTMIEMVGAAASRLDAWIIAEGIELSSEMDELIRLRVPLAQGYLLGRPAPAMQPVDPAVTAAIRSRSHTIAENPLAPHLSACQLVAASEAAPVALGADSSAREVIVVDEWRRPVALVQRHALLGTRTLPDFMRAQVASHPAEVLQRALTREECLRFDPIVVIGSEGETLGVVSVDGLMRALLATGPAEAPRS